MKKSAKKTTGHRYKTLFLEIRCVGCAKKGAINLFRSRREGVLFRAINKLESEICQIENSASESLSQIDEMRIRKRTLQTDFIHFDRQKVKFPVILKDLFENTISPKKVSPPVCYPFLENVF